MAALRWTFLLLFVASAVQSAAPAADGAAPALVPGEDLAVLQDLGWAGDWDLQGQVVHLDLKAPSGTAWRVDDLMRLQAEGPVQVRASWTGDLRPERLVVHLASDAGPCEGLELVASGTDRAQGTDLLGEASAACQGPLHIGLEVALPQDAEGSGRLRLAFLPALP